MMSAVLPLRVMLAGRPRYFGPGVKVDSLRGCCCRKRSQGRASEGRSPEQHQASATDDNSARASSQPGLTRVTTEQQAAALVATVAAKIGPDNTGSSASRKWSFTDTDG